MLKFKTVALTLALCTVASLAFAKTNDYRFPLGNDVSARFTGTVHRNDLINLDDTYKIPQTNCISFEPGSRSGWHVHGGMVIIGVEGEGIYQEYGKPAVLIRKGDVVEIPAGVSHWHGATKNSRFQQLVIYDKNWKAPEGLQVHKGKVTDEEYAALKFVDAPTYEGKVSKEWTFNLPKEKYKSPNFTKPVYLKRVVDKENAAGSPAWAYVAFGKGVYNRWHTHGEGQILIATDGIGLHQLSHGEVQVMYPGDVAYCPPGKTHWHGAAPNSKFAHLAISPAGKHTVEWLEFLPKEKYKYLP
ncbi:MAG: cupin domain-containing protein [Phascolarctobacterium sp.]|nr:cupin domain-containing protein [Phascolarctobacterium sp.]